MNHTFNSTAVYAVIVNRISHRNDQIYSSVLFYNKKQKAEEYMQSLLNDNAFKYLKPAVCIIECSINGINSESSWILPTEYSIPAIVPISIPDTNDNQPINEAK